MRILTVPLALFIWAWPAIGQAGRVASRSAVQEPRDVSYCELVKDPATHSRELIRLTAFITHGFEDFGLAEPNCPASPTRVSLWVMYGGKAQSNTVYCCPGEAGSESRSQSLVVDGIEVPLQDDLMFRRFKDLLIKESDTTVRVTVVGRFFSGEKQTYNGSTWWGGFGHLGCCSLVAIQRVEKFEPHSRNDVDYSAEGGWYEEEGCDAGAVRWLRHVSIKSDDGASEQAITEQVMAEKGERAWAFTDPERVAVEALKAFYNDRAPNLRTVRKSPTRYVFRWKNGGHSIIVVVTRPYWLSFYSKSGSVVWIACMIKDADCQ